MGRFGATELLLLLGLAVLFFGGRKLGDVGRGLGEAVRNLKQGLKDEPEASVSPVLPKKDEPGAETGEKA